MQNGTGINSVTHDEALKILIVGAGIGGLAAAVALRQHGHDVEIFESSRFATETGAAIHIAPNANGLLERLDISADAIGANECAGFESWSAVGTRLSSQRFDQVKGIWKHQWVLAHRVRLHNALKSAATSLSGKGRPARLHLSTPIADVDPVTATVCLKDGSRVQGDLIVGADGVHSVTRSRLPGVSGTRKAFGSGKSAFRFMVPKQALLDDPATRKYVEEDGIMYMCIAKDRRIVMYPTNNNTLMNFVAIHPEAETASAATGDWNNAAPKELLLEVYRHFAEDWRNMFSKADNESLKVWKLLDMDLLDTWVNDRLVLLGDAAHPFLPHQGQGAGQAIEDAMALAVVLEKGLLPDEVPDRLKLYQSIRKERAEKIQHYSRINGKDNVNPQEVAKLMVEFTNYNFGHDEYDNARQRLREWKWAKQPRSYWRMPKAFGPMPGPRQSAAGLPRDGNDASFVTASIKVKTSRTVLQNLFPPGSTKWRFKYPGTVAFCSFSQTTLDNMEWLGGSGYNHLGLYIHGVEYVKDDGSVVSGTYLPIIFENLGDPIVSGREELGMPKLYSAIDVKRDSNSYHIRASWKGQTWGRFEFNNVEDISHMNGAPGKIAGDTTDEGILAYRVIPAVGRHEKGKADVEYAVFDPFSEAEPKPRPLRYFTSRDASVTFTPTIAKRFLRSTTSSTDLPRYQSTKLCQPRLWKELAFLMFQRHEG